MYDGPSEILDLVIYPSYAKGAATIFWVTTPMLRRARFFVYKKVDGGAEWELLNKKPIYGTQYTDTNFYTPNLKSVPEYRLLANLNGVEYESAPVAVHARTGKKAFGIASNIIRNKYYQARQDGIPVLYYPAISEGEYSDSVDPDTLQRENVSCATLEEAVSPAGEDYGTLFKGGYHRPFITFVRFLQAKLQKENILEEGVYDDATQVVELLPFPPARAGDLIVDVTTDRRWTLNTSIKSYMVKGAIPVGYMTSVTQLPHNHAAYKVPIPTNYHEKLIQLYNVESNLKND